MSALSSAQLRGIALRTSGRLYLLTIRQGARRFLDLFRFGEATTERLAAAAVVGGVFFLAIAGGSMATRAPIGWGLGIAGGVLLVAWGTSALFVFGPTDSALADRVTEIQSQLLDVRLELQELLAREREAAAEEDERQRQQAAKPVPCPYCRAPVSRLALKCRHCSEYLDNDLRQQRERAGRRPNFYPGAAILSAVFPGLGQIFKGQVVRGLLFMLAAFAGLVCIIAPGVVIHLINIFDAAIYNE